MKRYKIGDSTWQGKSLMDESENGEYVRFEDVKEIIKKRLVEYEELVNNFNRDEDQKWIDMPRSGRGLRQILKVPESKIWGQGVVDGIKEILENLEDKR